MTATRKSLRQVIADLEASNSLSKPDADSLRDAPRWSLTKAEITGYLGGGIIAVGLTWIIIAIAQDLSRATVYFVLYVVGAVAFAIARWLHPRGVRSAQVSEVLFGLGVGSLAGAIGLTLNDLDVRGSIAVAIVSTLAIIIGLTTCTRTSFVGTLLVVSAAQPLLGSISDSFHISESVFPLVIILSGALLVALGLQRVGAPLVARVVGSASIVMGSVAFAATNEGSFQPILSIAMCSTLFYVGARQIDLELIVGGGIGITIAMGILAARTFDTVVMQGAVVTITGVVISALSLTLIKRRGANPS